MLSTTRKQFINSSFIRGVRMYSEGATGAPRPNQQGQDAFQKRERATEDYYIKQHEAEKLKAWKALKDAQAAQQPKEKLSELQKEFDDKEQQLNKAKDDAKN